MTMIVPILLMLSPPIIVVIQSLLLICFISDSVAESKKFTYLLFSLVFALFALVVGLVAFIHYRFSPHNDGTYLGPAIGYGVIIFLTIVGMVINSALGLFSARIWMLAKRSGRGRAFVECLFLALLYLGLAVNLK